MPWVDTGTVAIANDGSTVTGTGTAFNDNVQVGEAIQIDGRSDLFEITAINSQTELTIAPKWPHNTISTAPYRIVPTKGFARSAFLALQQAIATFDAFKQGIGAGLFPDGSDAAPGMAFKNDSDSGLRRVSANKLAWITGGVRRITVSNTEARIDVPVTGEATQNDLYDETGGRLMRVGAFGLGATDNSKRDLRDGLKNLPTGFFGGDGSNSDQSTFPGGATVYNPVLNLNRHVGGDDYTSVRVFFDGVEPIILRRGSLEEPWDDPNFLFGTENLLGPVSMDGNRPTGSVFERGSNSSGHYTRYADGSQMCVGDIEIDTDEDQRQTFPMPASFNSGFPTVCGFCVPRDELAGSGYTDVLDTQRETPMACSNFAWSTRYQSPLGFGVVRMRAWAFGYWS